MPNISRQERFKLAKNELDRMTLSYEVLLFGMLLFLEEVVRKNRAGLSQLFEAYQVGIIEILVYTGLPLTAASFFLLLSPLRRSWLYMQFRVMNFLAGSSVMMYVAFLVLTHPELDQTQAVVYFVVGFHFSVFAGRLLHYVLTRS